MALPLKPIRGCFFLVADLAHVSEDSMRAKVRECHGVGYRTLVPTLAAEHGRSYAPSTILLRAERSHFSYVAKRLGEAVTLNATIDPFAILLDECEALGMDVFMPTGTLSPEKPGSKLMWPYPAPQWFTADVAERNRRFVRELSARYGDSPAFSGWYISDEMKWSIEEHAILVEPIVAVCREMTPDVPILMSPAAILGPEKTRYLGDPDAVEQLGADIICPMDACGYTHHGPEMWTDEMFETIREAHAATAAACARAGKRYWANVEMFYYDRARHGDAPFAASWARVLRQIEIASDYAESLLSFQYFGLIDAPDSAVPLAGEGASDLYQGLAAHNAGAR